MMRRLSTPTDTVVSGLWCIMIGVVVGIPLGIFLLGKTEASRDYSNLPLRLVYVIVIALPIIGVLLALSGVVWAITKKLKK